MRHDHDSEGARLLARPPEEPTSLLALIRVTAAVGVEQYAARLRQVLRVSIALASRTDSDVDDIDLQVMPEWFVLLTDGQEGLVAGDPSGSGGKQLYIHDRSERPWDLEDWFYCFDPELRAWQWWDVTCDDSGRIGVWLDTKGEAHIPCEEIWWLVYVAGASKIDPLVLEHSAMWKREASVPQ
jgi:hypothetical protein